MCVLYISASAFIRVVWSLPSALIYPRTCLQRDGQRRATICVCSFVWDAVFFHTACYSETQDWTSHGGAHGGAHNFRVIFCPRSLGSMKAVSDFFEAWKQFWSSFGFMSSQKSRPDYGPVPFRSFLSLPFFSSPLFSVVSRAIFRESKGLLNRPSIARSALDRIRSDSQ